MSAEHEKETIDLAIAELGLSDERTYLMRGLDFNCCFHNLVNHEKRGRGWTLIGHITLGARVPQRAILCEITC